MMNFADRVVMPALRNRGPLPLTDIYDNVKYIARLKKVKLTPHWRATVRNTLQRHCKGHSKQRGKVRFIHYCHGTWGAK
jgi:hypothetical protein